MPSGAGVSQAVPKTGDKPDKHGSSATIPPAAGGGVAAFRSDARADCRTPASLNDELQDGPRLSIPSARLRPRPQDGRCSAADRGQSQESEMRHDSSRANACQRLEDALATLDPHARSLMEGYLQGRSVAEIAAGLEAPEGAVADKIRQLVDDLRSRMRR